MKDRTNEPPPNWYDKPAPDEPRGSFGDALGKRPSRDAKIDAIAERQAAAKAASDEASDG